MSKRFFAGIAAIALLAGLYFHNRHRLVPAGNGVTNIASHPAAPEFSLPALTGQAVKLSDYRGEVVLLDFWATWCDPCRDEIPHFVELQNKYGSQGLQVIGISLDDEPSPVRGFYKQFKMNYPVVMGDAKISELYGGVLGLPVAFLIGRDGRISTRHIGATDSAVFEREIKPLLATTPQ